MYAASWTAARLCPWEMHHSHCMRDKCRELVTLRATDKVSTQHLARTSTRRAVASGTLAPPPVFPGAPLAPVPAGAARLPLVLAVGPPSVRMSASGGFPAPAHAGARPCDTLQTLVIDKHACVSECLQRS